MAFKSSSTPYWGMSVDIECLMLADGVNPKKRVPAGSGAVRLNTGEVRGLGLLVGKNPTQTNKYHGEVWWKNKNFPKNIKKTLRDLGVKDILVRIEGL